LKEIHAAVTADLHTDPVSLLRLRVVADADSLIRVLERFQSLNVPPRRIVAEFTTSYLVSIQLDLAGIEESRLSGFAAQIAKMPCVRTAYWHYA